MLSPDHILNAPQGSLVRGSHPASDYMRRDIQSVIIAGSPSFTLASDQVHGDIHDLSVAGNTITPSRGSDDIHDSSARGSLSIPTCRHQSTHRVGSVLDGSSLNQLGGSPRRSHGHCWACPIAGGQSLLASPYNLSKTHWRNGGARIRRDQRACVFQRGFVSLRRHSYQFRAVTHSPNMRMAANSYLSRDQRAADTQRLCIPGIKLGGDHAPGALHNYAYRRQAKLARDQSMRDTHSMSVSGIQLSYLGGDQVPHALQKRLIATNFPAWDQRQSGTQVARVSGNYLRDHFRFVTHRIDVANLSRLTQSIVATQ